MTFDVLKKAVPEDRDSFDSETDRQTIIDGITVGTIRTKRQALALVNQESGKKLGGNDVYPVYESLIKELEKTNALADKLAAEGKPILEIVDACKDGSFDILQLKVMKEEIYGSVANWLAAMTSSEA